MLQPEPGVCIRRSGLKIAIRRLTVFALVLLSIKGYAQIEQDTVILQEIEIMGKVTKVQSIEVIDLKNEDKIQVRDIGDLLRGQANISGIRKGGIGIDPVIRGFRYDQVNVLFDRGLHLEGGCPNRMDPVASHIEADDIWRIEIARGPYVFRYGPALGAMVRLQTSRPVFYDNKQVHGEATYAFETNWNGQKEYLRIYGGGRKFSFVASGGQKLYGGYIGGNEKQYETGFQKWHASLLTAVKLTEKMVLEADYRFNSGNDVRYPALPMDEVSDRTHIGKISLNSKTNLKVVESFSILMGYSSVDHLMDNHFRSNYDTMQASTQVAADTWSFNSSMNLRKGKWIITPGIDFERITKDGTKTVTMIMEMGGLWTSSTKLFNVWNDAYINNYGLFTEVKHSRDKFEFIFSLRGDLNQASSKDTFELKTEEYCYFCDLYSSFYNISFGAGVTWELSSSWSLGLSLGRGTRSPSMVERFIKLMPVNYDPYDYLGNPQLRPETNHQLDVSASFSKPSLGGFTLSGFFSLVSDYITGKRLPPSLIKPTTQGVLGVKQFVNMDYAYLTGFEFLYQSPAKYPLRGRGSVALTYGIMTEATNYIKEGNQVVSEEQIYNDAIPEIPPLEVDISVLYNFLDGKLIPEIGIKAAADQKHVSDSFDETASPSWFVMNFSIRYFPIKWLQLNAGINNIFDVAYYDHLNRRIIGTKENFYEPGRVFYVGVTAKF